VTPARFCRQCGAEIAADPRASAYCSHECRQKAAQRIIEAARWVADSPIAVDGRATWRLADVTAARHLEAAWLSGLLDDIAAMRRELLALEAEARRQHGPVFRYVSGAGAAALAELRLWRSR